MGREIKGNVNQLLSRRSWDQYKTYQEKHEKLYSKVYDEGKKTNNGAHEPLFVKPSHELESLGR